MALVKSLVFFDAASRRLVRGVVKRTVALPCGKVRVRLDGGGSFDLPAESYKNGLSVRYDGCRDFEVRPEKRRRSRRRRAYRTVRRPMRRTP